MKTILQAIANIILPPISLSVYVVYAVEDDKMKEVKVFTRVVKAQDEYERMRKIYKEPKSFCGFASRTIL